MRAVLSSAAIVSFLAAVVACGSSSTPVPSTSAPPSGGAPTATETLSTNSPQPSATLAIDSATLSALQLNRTKWEGAGIENYEYQEKIDCFCTLYHPPLTIVVHGGELYSMTNSTGVAMTPGTWYDRYGSWATVEGLFQQIEKEATTDYRSVSVPYDPNDGFPTSFSADTFAASDALRVVTISNFRVLE